MLGCVQCNGYFGLEGFGLGDDGDGDSNVPLPISIDASGQQLPVTIPSTSNTSTCGFLDDGSYSCNVVQPGQVTPGATALPSFGASSTTPTTTNQSTISTSGGGAGVNWNAIAASFTNTFGAIAKSMAGANPTYQSCNAAGQCTTIYSSGSSASGTTAASLLSSASIAGISLPMLLIGGVALVALMAMMEGGKR